MKLFEKHSAGSYLAGKSDRVATGIAGFILKVQEWFALFLGAKTRSWKRLHQQFFLLGIVLCFGGLSMAAIILAFSKRRDTSSFKPQAIAVPAKANKPAGSLLITEKEYHKVQAFKLSQPRLAKDNPGLYDSLLLVEEAYHMQSRK